MYQTHVKDVGDPTIWAQDHHLPELDCPPRSARYLYRDGELEDALEMLRLRATYRLDRRMDVPVAREDLMELLASDLPEVRLLGIRLAARGSGPTTRRRGNGRTSPS